MLRISADRIEDQRQAAEAPDGHYLIAVRIAAVVNAAATTLAMTLPVSA